MFYLRYKKSMPRKIPTMNEVFDKDNLKRAWRWIKSNPDRRYKDYFRELYSEYSIIEDYILDDLSNQIKSKTYEPSHGCKIFIPKSSGILRGYTLLTVEDQIVYQAMVNIIAEHLVVIPGIKSNYYLKNFGNLYAGKSSVWFYRKWSDGYKKFNDAARDAFNNGLTYSASFDLTACYDSIDHKVLRHFLKEIKCDDEFIDILISCLSKWTGNQSSQIYHNHGIPQGPLASGLLSEVVLKYFDVKYGNPPQMRYMRYVDDIRLFASSEKELRLMLIQFDRLSKNIGLFPQSSKIEIHEVKNIEEELKSVSNPTESAIKWKFVNQDKLQKRIIALTKGYKISNQTRFKYLLAHAIPSSKINSRVWRLFKENPSNFETTLKYFQRYDFLPDSVVNLIINEIITKPVYSAITAALFETLDGRVRSGQVARVQELLKKEWRPNVLGDDIVLHVAIGRPVVRNNLINTEKQMRFALGAKEWYARSSLVQSLDNGNIAPNFLSQLLNEKIRDDSNDTACSAAVIMVKRNIALTGQKKKINLRAAAILKETGLISRMPAGASWCAIEIHFNKWLGQSITTIDWKTIFGSNYKQACTLAFNCRKEAAINITAWVNYMDVFNDLVLNSLFLHDPTIGNHILGNIGGSISSNRSPFARKYPCIFAMAKSIHDKRLESELSHARTRSTGKPTGPIKHKYFNKEGKILVLNAFKEIALKW
ncbi:MAG: reverse transcriptase domain-containing protein [bacterium]